MDVPAKGKRLKATFPKGQDKSLLKDGNSREEEETATAAAADAACAGLVKDIVVVAAAAEAVSVATFDRKPLRSLVSPEGTIDFDEEWSDSCSCLLFISALFSSFCSISLSVFGLRFNMKFVLS